MFLVKSNSFLRHSARVSGVRRGFKVDSQPVLLCRNDETDVDADENYGD